MVTLTAEELAETSGNREEWLRDLVDALRDRYDGELPETVHVSVGFTSKGMRSTRVGECWHGIASSDGAPHVFIHPLISDGVDVAAILVHELVHACRPTAKHGPAFKQMAIRLGLTGKMTATVPSDELRASLAEVIEDIGPYPHPQLSGGGSSNGPKQTTRMLKLECPECGYLVRTSSKWLEVGLPMCPDGDTLLPAE
jgi:hypothetical protein